MYPQSTQLVCIGKAHWINPANVDGLTIYTWKFITAVQSLQLTRFGGAVQVE
jgi:hypothetical protein